MAGSPLEVWGSRLEPTKPIGKPGTDNNIQVSCLQFPYGPKKRLKIPKR